LKKANATNNDIIDKVKHRVNFDGEIIRVGKLKRENKNRRAPIPKATIALV
jgi:hypothetical protein